jgi:phosphatidylinositol alpha-1,6-mannosyltransferase
LRPAWAERLGLSGKRVLLTHGRLDPRKGHDVVIRALPEIVAQHPDVVYLVTGTGESEPVLRELASSLGMGSHAVFAGVVGEEALPEIYSLAEIVLVPSRRVGFSIEGFGIVCLEAAAAGKPVIAGRSGGLPSAIVDGETGVLVDPESPRAIAGAALALLGDPARARAMGRCGRARVVRHFDRRAFARRIADFVAAASRA